MMGKSRIHNRCAFTLLEMLVVIGIIALLMALLVPAVSRVRAQSQTVACASNLRQLALAANLYANDNDGFYPPAHFKKTSGTPPNSVSGAPVLLKAYSSSENALIQCPVDPQAINVLELYGLVYPVDIQMPQYASYQYNFAVFVNALTNPSAQPTNRSTLRDSSDLIILYDGTVSSDRGGPWEVIAARHSGPSFNAVFLDSHVESIHAMLKGKARGMTGFIPAYVVDVGNRPIYYAGAQDIPYRTTPTSSNPTGKVASQGLAIPGFGPIVWGQVNPN